MTVSLYLDHRPDYLRYQIAKPTGIFTGSKPSCNIKFTI